MRQRQEGAERRFPQRSRRAQNLRGLPWLRLGLPPKTFRLLRRKDLALPRKCNQIDVAVQVLDGFLGRVTPADGVGEIQCEMASGEVKLKFLRTLLGGHLS